MKIFRPGLIVAAVISFSGVTRADEAKPALATEPVESNSKAAADVPQGGIEVVRLVVCRGVQDREPSEEVTSAKVGDALLAWTQIRSGLGEVTVTHRWLHEEDNAGDVPLAVKSSPWRTWSRKTVAEAGNWKVQVLNSEGAVLKEVAFTVAP